MMIDGLGRTVPYNTTAVLNAALGDTNFVSNVLGNVVLTVDEDADDVVVSVDDDTVFSGYLEDLKDAIRVFMHHVKENNS